MSRQAGTTPIASLIQCCQVGAAVNVICELAKNNPKNYIRLVSVCASLALAVANDHACTHAKAPELYQLLHKSANNWMLIKVRA